MVMAIKKEFKVLALPAECEPDAIYYVLQSDNTVKTFVTNKVGIPRLTQDVFALTPENIQNSSTAHQIITGSATINNIEGTGGKELLSLEPTVSSDITVRDANSVSAVGIIRALASAGSTISRFIADRIRGRSVSKDGIRLENPVHSALITALDILTFGRYAVLIGTNTYANQDNYRDIAVTGFNIKGGLGTGSDEAHGLLTYGHSQSVWGGVISEIQGPNDSEGDYSKARYSTHGGIVLRNAGNGDGALALKGSQRGETSSPNGFMNVRMGYAIVFESAYVAAVYNTYATDKRFCTGIFVSNEDSIVSNCVVEGCTGSSLVTTDKALPNLLFSDLIIRNHKSSTAVGLYHSAGRTVLRNITIDGVDNRTLPNGSAATGATYGIRIEPAANVDEIIIDGVLIKNIQAAAGQSKTGIGLVITGVTVRRVIIRNTHIEDGDNGIYFFSTGTITDLILENVTFGAAITNKLRFGSSVTTHVTITNCPALDTFASVGALPTASARYRDNIFKVQANGSLDTRYICRKTAADTYEWALL